MDDDVLLEQWNTTIDFEERDRIIEELKQRNLFPSTAMTRWEAETGAYPLLDDPEFLQKLLAKREFAESLQTTWEPAEDPCRDDTRFEVTPVQRFVTNLMSPKSPYMSALLYHGVGVGKTCAAVQITEAWLQEYPRDKIFLVAPPTIQNGFLRTMFNSEKVTIPEEEGIPNRAVGCTGDTYMKLTGTMLEKDRAKIHRRTLMAIRRRYNIFGYTAFANYIRDLLKTIPATASEEKRAKLENSILRKEFSGKLLVVDEAHNLRDLAETVEEAADSAPGGKTELSDAAAGKQLTPYLRKVLSVSEGLKLVLLTATPMYNSYREIIFILNLLLQNEKQAELSEADIFTKEGELREGAAERLGAIARRYVSFMRGENPRSFPLRLSPLGLPKLNSVAYPRMHPRGAVIKEADKIFINHLPIIPVPLEGDALIASTLLMNELPPGDAGLSGIVLGRLVQAGNFIVPATEGTEGRTLEAYSRRLDADSMGTVFTKRVVGGEIQWKAREEVGARWLGIDQLAQYAPKFVAMMNRIRTSEGVDFIYTRFVNSSALPLALALEANGYTPYGRKTGLLANGIQTPGKRQCALCERREEGHPFNGHTFTPAYYGLLTGDDQLSPRNEQTIQAERDMANKDGIKMKVIIGSQIAAEGVDFRFVREIHVVDSWYHLNKTEQILGRGIRFCSHSALPVEKRNTTIYLYAGILPSEMEKESADLYSYRVAFLKAVQVGRVSRVLKTYAIDCNLNHDAILIQGQEAVRQIDSQRVERPDVSINDMPFTAICDWTECAYECRPKIEVNPVGTDDSTYSEFAARFRESSLKERIRKLFALQTHYRKEDLWEMMDTPSSVIIDILASVVDNRLFQVNNNGVDGYIRYCNGYYVFQPNIYGDLSIPLSMRVAKIPVKRDEYNPALLEYVREVDVARDEEDVGERKVTGSVNDVWSAIVEWATAIASSKELPATPKIITSRIREIGQGNSDIEEKLRQIIEMLEWFQISFKNSSGELTERKREAMRIAVLEFFWDNWFSLDEQKYLVEAKAIGASTMIRDAVIDVGRIHVQRFLNPKDGEIVFICEGGEPCSRSIVDNINRRSGSGDDRDKLKGLKVNTGMVGELYGFMAPKNGTLVFKTNEPSASGKIGRGAECAIVSTMSGHIKKLVQMGDVLRRERGMGDLDLRREQLVDARKIENATRACTILELALRFMDRLAIDGKRWFLRPTEAFYTGHKGRIGKA